MCCCLFYKKEIVIVGILLWCKTSKPHGDVLLQDDNQHSVLSVSPLHRTIQYFTILVFSSGINHSRSGFYHKTHFILNCIIIVGSNPVPFLGHLPSGSAQHFSNRVNNDGRTKYTEVPGFSVHGRRAERSLVAQYKPPHPSAEEKIGCHWGRSAPSRWK